MLFSGPSLCEREAVRSRWKIVVFVFFFFFKRWNWLSGVTLHILLWHFWYYCSTFWGEKLAFFSVSSRNVGENVSTEWAEGELDSSATDCRTEAARLFTCARFCPLCTFYHILQTGNPLTSVDVNATANPPATPVTPAHTLLPCLHTQSCILTQFRLPVHSLTGPPERDCCPLHLPAAGQPLCCLLITSATIVSGRGGDASIHRAIFCHEAKVLYSSSNGDLNSPDSCIHCLVTPLCRKALSLPILRKHQ